MKYNIAIYENEEAYTTTDIYAGGVIYLDNISEEELGAIHGILLAHGAIITMRPAEVEG